MNITQQIETLQIVCKEIDTLIKAEEDIPKQDLQMAHAAIASGYKLLEEYEIDKKLSRREA